MQRGSFKLVKLKTYILRSTTCLIIPKYDEHGHLYSCVLEGRQFVEVDLSPTELIDWNLKHFGSSFIGAMQGMRNLLRRANMMPVMINQEHGICWFPSRSPQHPDCVWFALRHVEHHESTEPKKTKVLLANNYAINIDMSVQSFERRLYYSYMTKYKMEYRTQQIIAQPLLEEPIIMIVKESGRNYVVKKLK